MAQFHLVVDGNIHFNFAVLKNLHQLNDHVSKAAGVKSLVGTCLGSIIPGVGMGLAYLMTWPTANQLVNYQGIAGAHAVGVSDGGPGLPLSGWSTVASDLRVGHFCGLHSIQVAAILLALSLLIPLALRVPLILFGNLTRLGFVGLVTWQSLRAEPLSSPIELTITSFGFLVAIASIIFVVLSLAQSRAGTKRVAQKDAVGTVSRLDNPSIYAGKRSVVRINHYPPAIPLI